MTTYSQSIVGLNQSLYEVGTLQVNDAQAQQLTTQTLGAQTLAMQQGLRFLCKNPDGSYTLYHLDAERSIPGQKPILRAVGP